MYFCPSKLMWLLLVFFFFFFFRQIVVTEDRTITYGPSKCFPLDWTAWNSLFFRLCVCVCVCVRACVQSLSRIWLFVTPWNGVHQAHLSLRFSQQEYWSGLSCATPTDLPDSGIKTTSPASPVLAGGSWPLSHLGSLFRLNMAKYCQFHMVQPMKEVRHA